METNETDEQIIRRAITRVRNDTLATIFHHLKDKVSAKDLAELFDMHAEQINNLERAKYGKSSKII